MVLSGEHYLELIILIQWSAYFFCQFKFCFNFLSCTFYCPLHTYNDITKDQCPKYITHGLQLYHLFADSFRAER